MARLPAETRIDPYAGAAAQVGPWQVQTRANRVLRDGVEVRLPPKVMLLLRCLMARAQQVVSRETLLDSVWPEADVGEEVLTQSIAELRRALGDNPRDGQGIETIRKVGYRLRADVQALDQGFGPHSGATPVAAPTAEPATPAVLVPAAPTPWIRNSLTWLMLLLLGVLLATWAHRTRTAAPEAGLSAVPASWRNSARPLTSDLGSELWPAIAPDGSAVAYLSITRPDGGLLEELKLRVTGSGESRTLARTTLKQGFLQPPAWSADGQQLVFIRLNGPRCTVIALSLAAEAPGERKLADCHPLESSYMQVSWSPTGDQLALTQPLDPSDSGSPVRIHLLNLLSGSMRALDYEVPTGNSRRPQFSADGRQLLFAHGQPPNSQLYVVATRGGPARALTRLTSVLQGFSWLPGSTAVVYAVDNRLLRLSIEDLRINDLHVESAIQPSAARQGETLVYATPLQSPSNLQRFVIEQQDSPVPYARPRETLFASTRHSSMPRWSPDGRWIAFVSDRTGSPQLWLGETVGNTAKQLSRLAEGSRIDALTWLPDGRSVAVALTDRGGHGHIQLQPVDGSAARELWQLPSGLRAVSASADGRSLYVAPDKPDAQLRQLDLRTGRDVRLPLADLQSLLDGGAGWLYFGRVDDPAIYRIADDFGSPPERIPGTERVNPRSGWALTESGLVVWASVVGGEALMLTPLDGRSPPQLFSGISGSFSQRDFILSADSRELIFPVDGSRESDLMLIGTIESIHSRPD